MQGIKVARRESTAEQANDLRAAVTTAFDRDPAATRARLVAMEEARGLDAAASAAAADRLMQDRNQALHALAAHELGIAYGDIGGSPWGAAAMAFLLFPAGAILSLIPFLLVADHAVAVGGSLGLAGLGLFAVGAAITGFTGRSALFSGCRQLAFGGVAALAIYGIGRLFGG